MTRIAFVTFFAIILQLEAQSQLSDRSPHIAIETGFDNQALGNPIRLGASLIVRDRHHFGASMLTRREELTEQRNVGAGGEYQLLLVRFNKYLVTPAFCASIAHFSMHTYSTYTLGMLPVFSEQLREQYETVSRAYFSSGASFTSHFSRQFHLRVAIQWPINFTHYFTKTWLDGQYQGLRQKREFSYPTRDHFFSLDELHYSFSLIYLMRHQMHIERTGVSRK